MKSTPLEPVTVLVVEDDALLRRSLALSLSEHGFRVVGVADGQEALHYLHRAPPPAVIVLDLSMPVLDGWQFRRQQLDEAALATIPVLLLTAADDVAGHASSLGIATYLQKPVPFEELIAAIRKLAEEGPHRI